MQQATTLLLALVCLVLSPEIHSEIINGYEKELSVAKRTRENLRCMSTASLSRTEHRKLNRMLKKIERQWRYLQEMHRKTQVLIEALKMIDPALYYVVSTIRDRDGNTPTVYIQAVNELKANHIGITNLEQCPGYPNVYTSEHGKNTVSVKVVYRSAVRALWTLVHELGHVKYQVPNLASYLKYYQKEYLSLYFEGAPGHGADDPSHHTVKETLSTFDQHWRAAVTERKLMGRSNSQNTLALIRSH